MGVDFSALKPGCVTVVESPRRLRREQSYGFIRALWWIWMEDGRSAASVPPGTRKAVEEILKDVHSSRKLFDPDIAEKFRTLVNDTITRAGLKPVNRIFSDITFACNASLLRPHRKGDCRRLADESILPTEGLRLPTHCFPDGIVYGVVVEDKVVSIAFAHRNGVMEDRVADLGVETAPAYRRCGYAKTVVSAVVEHIVSRGGEARYGCRPDNQASVATARSVGFVPYGNSLSLSTPSLDVE